MIHEDMAITELLSAWKKGDRDAENLLWSQIYPHLRAISANRLAAGPVGVKETSSLIHEAYIKLADQRTDWENRSHFFAVAARVMRRVLCDHARSGSRNKRGDHAWHVSLEDLGLAAMPSVSWVEFDSALNQLSEIDPDLTRVVELRLLIGFSVQETARLMGIGVATVGRHLRFAKSWLKNALT